MCRADIARSVGRLQLDGAGLSKSRAGFGHSQRDAAVILRGHGASIGGFVQIEELLRCYK